VPEDRFGDLGGPPAGGTRAGDKLADLDRREPEPDAGPPPPRRPSGRYAWVVGVAAVIAIAVAGINSLGNAGGGTQGLPAGAKMPRFAAPSATSHLEGDANVKQHAGDQGTNNETPACEVRLEGSLRSCDYTAKPFVLTFIVPGAKDCEAFLDRVQRIHASYPRVNFMGVISGAETSEARKLVEKHGWTFPVVVDHNLALFNTYRVSLCATSVFAYRGGVVRRSVVETQKLSDAQLATEIGATTLR
jgi:peroxiredoxin